MQRHPHLRLRLPPLLVTQPAGRPHVPATPRAPHATTHGSYATKYYQLVPGATARSDCLQLRRDRETTLDADRDFLCAQDRYLHYDKAHQRWLLGGEIVDSPDDDYVYVSEARS